MDILSPTDRKLITDSLALLERVKLDKHPSKHKDQSPRHTMLPSYKDCPICHCRLNVKNYDSHLEKVHNTNNTSPANLKKIKLISKRGTRLTGSYICSSCKIRTSTATKYANSNVGEVVLCSSCKIRIRKRSFKVKKIDALDMATTGGGFESNRRKH